MDAQCLLEALRAKVGWPSGQGIAAERCGAKRGQEMREQ